MGGADGFGRGGVLLIAGPCCQQSVAPKKAVRIYLDTSGPNLYYDNRYPERQQSRREFRNPSSPYEVMISTLVDAELRAMQALDPERAEMTLALIESFELVTSSPEARLSGGIYDGERLSQRSTNRC